MIKFEYDAVKDKHNQTKHGVEFLLAEKVFEDSGVIIVEDEKHSKNEQRYYAFGKVNGEVMTVRFTVRGNVVRIFGAAYWRKGRKVYEQENSL